MKRELSKVFKTHSEYESACDAVNEKLKEVCAFNAALTWCAGDGHLVLNVESTNVATLNCLIGKTAKNKLTEDQHEEFCI